MCGSIRPSAVSAVLAARLKRRMRNDRRAANTIVTTMTNSVATSVRFSRRVSAISRTWTSCSPACSTTSAPRFSIAVGNRHGRAHQRRLAAGLLEPDRAALAVARRIDRRAPHSVRKPVGQGARRIAGEQHAIDRAREAFVVALQSGILRRRRDCERAGARQQPAARVDDGNAHAIRCVLLQSLLQRFRAGVNPREPARLRDDCIARRRAPARRAACRTD